jgi:hypothetical protein
VPDENNKPATADGSMRTTTSGSTESTHDDPKRGETSCVVIGVKPEAAVTEK